MFCVIYEVNEKRRRGSSVVKSVEYADAGRGIEYYRAGIYKIKNKRDEEELKNALGRTVNHFVPEGDVVLPDSRGIEKIETYGFVRDLMLYKLIETVKEHKIQSAAVKCSDAVFADKCVCIAKYVRDVRLLCRNDRILNNYRSRVFSLYGASTGDNNGRDIITFDFDNIKIIRGSEVFSFEKIIYPAEIADSVPENVKKLDFFSAVYKYSGQKKYLLDNCRLIFSQGKEIKELLNS